MTESFDGSGVLGSLILIAKVKYKHRAQDLLRRTFRRYLRKDSKRGVGL